MVSESTKRKIAVTAVLVGVCLLLFGTYLFAYEWQAYSAYHVTETNESTVDERLSGADVNRDAVVLEYESLSPTARAAFEAALEADGRAEFRGEKHRAPEFRHASDVIDVGHGEYFVVSEGTYYRLRAYGPGPLGGVGAYLVGLPSAVFGALLVLGGLSATDRRLAVSVVPGVGSAVLVAWTVSSVGSVAVDRFERFLAAGALLCAIVAVAARIVSDRIAAALENGDDRSRD